MSRVVIIAGAQKARTSTLAAALARHDQVYFHPSEVVVFEYPHGSVAEQQRFRTFLESRPEPVVGFKRADLLGRSEAPGALTATFGSDVTIIVSLREPTDRAISGYFWYVRQGLIPPFEINAGLQQLIADGGFDGFPRSPEILGYSRYGRLLTRYEEQFGRDALFVTSEVSWDAGALSALSRVLDIDDLQVDAHLHLKAGQKSVRRARFTAVGQGSRGGAADWAGRFADRSLARSVERRARDLIDQKVLVDRIPPDVVTEQTRAALAAHFADDVLAARDRFGVTFDARPADPVGGAA